MEIIEVDYPNKWLVHQFLRLPFHIYSDIRQWVPPIDIDAKSVLNRQQNPFFQHGDAIFLLAMQGGKPVGRLSVLRNDHYIEYNRDPMAFFYLFECENNFSTAAALFEAGCEWARKQGLTHIIGPRGFSVFDGLGMLVDGFEHRPAFGLPYNLPYYPTLMEECGFSRRDEILSGYMDEKVEFPGKVRQIAELVKKRRGLNVAHFKNRSEIKKIAPYLKNLYNSSFDERSGNIPLTDNEVKTLLDQMLWIADPHLIKIIFKGDEPVGFLLAYPDISAAIQKTHGRLFPFGWLLMLIELKKTRWININGAGMKEGFRGSGGTAILFDEMYKSVARSRYRFADIVQIGADNEKMLREMREFGIRFYKTHRVYEKQLV